MPAGIAIGLIRVTFQMPGLVSWNPRDHVVIAVSKSVVLDDELRDLG